MIKKQDAINFFKNKGYEVIGEYINANTNVECLQTKTQYKVFTSYSDLKYGKNPSIFGKNNPFKNYNIELLIKNCNSNIKLISIKTIKKKDKVRNLCCMVCECGNEFNKTLDTIQAKRAKLVCPNCAKENRGLKRRNSKEYILNLIKESGYRNLENITNQTRNQKILVEDESGYRGYTSVASMMGKKHFDIFSIKTNKDNFIYNANIYSKNNCLKVKVIDFSDKEKWTRQGIKCQCRCGKYFETSIASFQNQKHLCDECSNKMSIYERDTKDFLEENNINYIKEFTFNDCRDILPLPFDFYLEDYHRIIEIDGAQHESVEKYKFVKTQEEKEYWFALGQKHDKIKNEYCKNNNIKLLRIPYQNVKNGKYKEQIMQFIKE